MQGSVNRQLGRPWETTREGRDEPAARVNRFSFPAREQPRRGGFDALDAGSPSTHPVDTTTGRPLSATDSVGATLDQLRTAIGRRASGDDVQALGHVVDGRKDPLNLGDFAIDLQRTLHGLPASVDRLSDRLATATAALNALTEHRVAANPELEELRSELAALKAAQRGGGSFVSLSSSAELWRGGLSRRAAAGVLGFFVLLCAAFVAISAGKPWVARWAQVTAAPPTQHDRTLKDEAASRLFRAETIARDRTMETPAATPDGSGPVPRN